MEFNNQEDRPQSLEELIRNLEEALIRTKHNKIYKAILDSVERPLIETVLERTFGNQLKAARILGINRNTLRTKIKKLTIDVRKFKT